MAAAGQKRGEFGSGHVKNNLQPDPYLSRFLTPPLLSSCLPSLFVYSINLFISIFFYKNNVLLLPFLGPPAKKEEKFLKLELFDLRTKTTTTPIV